METIIRFSYGVNNSIFKDAFCTRVKVFVDEQGIPLENERDEFDSSAYHFVAYYDNKPIACARLNIDHKHAKICRVAVVPTYRGNGIASSICKNCISFSREKNVDLVYLHAQTHVVKLYEKLGFISVGITFLEENIPHIRMEKHF